MLRLSRLFIRRLCTDSKRQEFLKIDPCQKTLDHLDHLGLGYVSKRRSRVAINDKYRTELPGIISNTAKRSNKLNSSNLPKLSAPFPFDRGPKSVTSIITASKWESVPNFLKVPEIAIIGRSNAGKSTLLNALLNFNASFVQKAAVSDKPGETKNLHFFSLGFSKHTKLPMLVLTDMPGYGFSLMSAADQQRCFMLVRLFPPCPFFSHWSVVIQVSPSQGKRFEAFTSRDRRSSWSKTNRLEVSPRFAHRDISSDWHAAGHRFRGYFSLSLAPSHPGSDQRHAKSALEASNRSNEM
jgi:hypothetical protein